MKIKIIALLLIVLTCVSFVSCKKEPTEDPATTTEVVTEAPIKITIAENGASQYKLINNANSKRDLIDLVIDCHNQIRALSGVTLPRGNDKKYGTVDYSQNYEIIVGMVDREESCEVYNSIGFDGYAVKSVGNKIIIAGYTYDTISLALQTFFTKCLAVEETENGKTLYYVNDVVSTGTEGLFFTEENPLSSYCIIYTTATASFAGRLAMAFDEQLGISIKTYKDTEPEREHEILLGSTNRAASAEVTSARTSEYAIKAVGKKLVINGDDETGLYHIISGFMEMFAYTGASINFPKNIDKCITKYTGTDKANLSSGADIRIMSFNILADDFHTVKDLTSRIPGVVGCVRYYKPDVVGFQEISHKWYEVLKEEFADEYTFVNSTVLGKTNNNYTAIAYRNETVECIDDLLHNYSKPGNSRIRVLNVGVFEHKATKKQFVVTSTHLSVGGDKDGERQVQAKEHAQLVEKFLWMYQCPVISTGDYNCYEDSAPQLILTASGVIKNSKYDALEKGRICNTHHSLGSNPANQTKGIDHIFYAGDITPIYFSVLVDDVLLITSDHCPLIGDFKLN